MPTTPDCTTPPAHVEDLTRPGQYAYRATVRDGELIGEAVLREEITSYGRWYRLHTSISRGTTKGRIGPRQKERGDALVKVARGALLEAARAAGWLVEERTWLGRPVECFFPPEPDEGMAWLADAWNAHPEPQAAPEPALEPQAAPEPALEPQAAPEPALEPCRWCGGDGCKSAMQPAFCADCVQAMLRGEDEARRDLYRPVTELPPVQLDPAPAHAPKRRRRVFTVRLTEEEAAVLEAETAAQNAWEREWTEARGVPARPLTLEEMAAAVFKLALQERAERARRREGGR